MASDLPSPRLVYLVCRNIFIGRRAILRRHKSIRRLLEERRNTIGQALLCQYNIEQITTVAKALLELTVFQSTLFAQAVFPDLFETSIARNMNRAAPKVHVARLDAHSMVRSGGLDGVLDRGFCASTDRIDPDKLLACSAATQLGLPAAGRTVVCTGAVSAPQPNYLPYNIQHEITTITQSLLEESCYEFGMTWLSGVMRAKGWDCSKSVELTDWSVVLQTYGELIPAESVIQVAGKPCHHVLAATHGLRHSAVHRRRLSTNEIELLLNEAAEFTRMIKDVYRLKKITAIRDRLRISIRALQRDSGPSEIAPSSSMCAKPTLAEIPKTAKAFRRGRKRQVRMSFQKSALRENVLGRNDYRQISLEKKASSSEGLPEKRPRGEYLGGKGDQIPPEKKAPNPDGPPEERPRRECLSGKDDQISLERKASSSESLSEDRLRRECLDKTTRYLWRSRSRKRSHKRS